MFKKRMNMLPASIHVVGCGGTGSRLIPMLVQLVASHPFLRTLTRIFIYDADVVEVKNLARQNFAPGDVGKNKAVVTAARYSKAYGIPVIGVPEFFPIDSSNQCRPDVIRNLLHSLETFRNGSILDEDITKAASRSSIWISCVDTIDARLSIMNMLMRFTEGSRSGDEGHPTGIPTNTSNISGALYAAGIKGSIADNFSNSYLPITSPIFIDAGNENTFGQVSICEGIVPHVFSVGAALNDFYYRDRDNYSGNNSNFFEDAYTEDISMDSFPLFMNLTDRLFGTMNPPQVEASCADLDQTLAVNAQMAIGILTYMQNILLNHPISSTVQYYDIHHGNGQDKLGGKLLYSMLHMPEGFLKGLDPQQSSYRGTTFNAHYQELIESLTAFDEKLKEMIPEKTLPSGASVSVVRGVLRTYISILSNASSQSRYTNTMRSMFAQTFLTKKRVDPNKLNALKWSTTNGSLPTPVSREEAIKATLTASPRPTAPEAPEAPPTHAVPATPDEEEARRAALRSILSGGNWTAVPVDDRPVYEGDDDGEEESEEDVEENR